MTNLKRIIFINQDSGYLMIDIINAYAAVGYRCSLITGRLNERNTPLHPTASVEKIIQYDRTTTCRRLWTWIIGFLQIWFKIVFKYRKEYLFVVSNPPFAPLLPLIVKNRFNLLIFDIYPDALTELGYLTENSLIIRLWRKANKRVYAKANGIFTITESMKQLLLAYAGSNFIKVVPVWTDNTFLRPIDPAENSFLKRHGLLDKFVVLYSGNIGLSGDVDVLVNVAERIKRDDIVFLIIGDGAKKIRLTQKMNELNLRNLILLPWQPVVELPFSLSSASLAVVSLGTKASKLAVPSKFFNYLSVGSPILCVSSKGSEIESLVSKYDCGRNFEPDDVTGMINFIVEIADNKELQRLLKANSLNASKNFGISNVNEFLITASYDPGIYK